MGMNAADDMQAKSVNSGKKIFCTDIDDTLVNTDKSLCEENRIALEEFLASGSYLVISSGRAPAGIAPLIKSLGLYGRPNVYISSYNGALITNTDGSEVIYSSPIPLEWVFEVFRYAHDFGIQVQTYTKDTVISDIETDNIYKYCKIQKIPPQIVEKIDDVLTQEPPKILVLDYDDPEHVARFRRYLEPRVAGRMDLFKSSEFLLEVVVSGNNKGKALHILADYLSVPIENTISAGDEENDLTMIQAAGIGCAMCNGKDVLKEAADYVTVHDNNHGGVAEIIRKFCMPDS